MKIAWAVMAVTLAALPSSAQTTAIDWSHDIAPLVYQHCTACHHPGGAGPFSLLRYEDARRWGAQMAAVTGSGYMPPWLPQAGFGDFADERRVTPAEIAQIARWVKAGMPQGEPSRAPAPPVYSQTWQYGTPDLILNVRRPFTLPASGSDLFRNFILPYPLQQTHYIRAMEIRPAVPQVVHHANLLIDRTASVRRAHPEQWQNGIPGMELAVDAGNEFDPDGHFLFWKPDTPVLVEPEGMPWRLDPGNDLVLNMHLKPSGKPEVADAQIGLYFAEQPPASKPMLLQLEHDAALDIPAGDRNFVVEDALQLPVDVQVLGIYPHAHYLGKRMEAWATLPDGRRQWLILIPSWDIDRQSVYRYRKPVPLPRGSVLHLRYVYDNSSANPHNPHTPAVRVRAGNRSEDEMAHLWLQVLPREPVTNGLDTRLLLEEAWMRSWLRKDPDDPVALTNVASALAQQGKYAEAIADYRHLLVLHPEDERTLNVLGATLENSGDFKQAQKIFAQDIAAHPETCDARFNLARSAWKHDAASIAEERFRDVLAHCPPDATMRDGLAAALESEGRLDAAQTEYQAALAIDARDFTALFNLGEMKLASGDTQEAIALLETAVAVQPGDLDAHQRLGGAYASIGQVRDAITQLRQALALAHSPDPDDWNNLGVLEARMGQVGDAREAFLRALAIAPTHAEARANLHRLPQTP